VCIPAAKHADALVALKALVERDQAEVARRGGRQRTLLSWLQPDRILGAETLYDALAACRWPVIEDDERGNITELEFRGEKRGSEDELFAALAPFVEDGSEIRMVGEDGTIWRWLFRDGKVCRQEGRIVFDGSFTELPSDSTLR
jgi:hypothetical protein